MTANPENPDNKRWYDHDPLLVEVLETLRSFKDELHTQSEIFLGRISEEVGQDAVDTFYAKVRSDLGNKFGNRWYDADPVVSKAVELLRVLPPDVQRKAAESFLQGMKDQGVSFPAGSQNPFTS